MIPLAAALGAVAAAALGLLVQAAAGAGGQERAAEVPRYFIIACRFSHDAPDDPIVYPRRTGRSHEHTFIGNVTTDAFSSPASLRGRASTCSRAGDASAYWVPTLYDDGRPVQPLHATIYYRRLTTAPVTAFPAGLVMIAGNSHAVFPQSTRVTTWRCGDVKSTLYGPRTVPMERADGPAAFPSCPPPSNLQLEVNFPNCTDGKLDAPDHESHMAYSVAGRCPKAHPIAVPAISIVLRYPPVSGANAFLASGGLYSGHADFMDGWNQHALSTLVATCLNSRLTCGYPGEPGALR